MIFGSVGKVIQKSKEERGTFFKTLASTGEVRTRVPLEVDSPVRMSNLPYFCAREEAIRTCIGGTTKEVINWPKRWVMNRGSGIHHAIQDHVLENIGSIDGMWMCQRCGKIHGRWTERREHGSFGLMPNPHQCIECGSRDNFTYVEATLWNKGLGLTGHPDGFWWHEEAVWEFKTCGVGTYRMVLQKGPSVANRVQGGGYLAMVNDLVRPERKFKSVYFLYVPMEDVSDVRIPAPDERVVPYEVDPDTRMIFYPLGEPGLKGYFDEAYARVTAYREWRSKVGKMKMDEPTIPRRHPSCTCAGNAGQWKWGCDFATGCMELGDKYEEKKDE